MDRGENYGKKNVTQPGGGKNATIKTLTNVANQERSIKNVVGPPRLGPAGTGNKLSSGTLNRKGR